MYVLIRNSVILNIIHRLVICLKHDVSDTSLCLRLQVELAQLVPVYVKLASLSLSLSGQNLVSEMSRCNENTG